jgi:hypothetical protein
MNEPILNLIRTFPRGGGYTWDPTKPTSGVTQDLVYKNKLILAKDVATYCCGLTFEVWFRPIGITVDIPVTEMQKVQQLWYCARDNRGGCKDALLAVRLGMSVNLTEARAGDFLQLWRKPTVNNPKGSGHSVVYLSHDNAAGTLTYFSTQRRTNGPGEQTERLENLAELYFVRALGQYVEFKP